MYSYYSISVANKTSSIFQQQLVILEGKASVNQLSLLPLLHPPDLLPSHLSPPVAHLALSHEPLSLGGDVVDALEDANKVVLNILSKL